jgi:hypothetical protein
MTAETCDQDKTIRTDAAVIHIDACACRVADYEWPYVEARRAAIDQHWTEAVAANPAFFDGVVLLTAACRVLPTNAQPSRLELTLFETRFRNFLFWRHHGFAGRGVIDAFGAAIVRASDGAILLVRQRPGNVNEGPYNFPCGFIDRSDIDASGRVDLAGNISREVAEEVGLGAADLERCPGFLVTRVGVHLAVGVEYRSSLPSKALAARIRAYLAAAENPEIAEAIFVRTVEQSKALELAPHCRQFLSVLIEPA